MSVHYRFAPGTLCGMRRTEAWLDVAATMELSGVTCERCTKQISLLRALVEGPALLKATECATAKTLAKKGLVGLQYIRLGGGASDLRAGLTAQGRAIVAAVST